MEIKGLLAIFVGVFLAELGDKTQIATMCFASDAKFSRLGVFLASSSALVASSLLAVLVGSQLDRWISPQYIKLAAGAAFVVIGVWFIVVALKG